MDYNVINIFYQVNTSNKCANKTPNDQLHIWSYQLLDNVPNRSGHRRKKELGDRAKGHTVDGNLKLLILYRIVYVLNYCVYNTDHTMYLYYLI